MIRPFANLLIPWLHSGDPYHRGLAAWAAHPLKLELLVDHLRSLCSDPNSIVIYMDGGMEQYGIGDLAAAAIDTISLV
jgi:hypothetical protein